MTETHSEVLFFLNVPVYFMAKLLGLKIEANTKVPKILQQLERPKATKFQWTHILKIPNLKWK